MTWMLRLRSLPLAQDARRNDRGQVIVLFALFLVGLLGVSAFVVDIARVYALQRYERSVADAAALAGAQDLQDVVNGVPRRTVSPGDYAQARCDALALLERELAGGSVSCAQPLASAFSSDIVDYPIVDAAGNPSPWVVSVKTDPSPSVMNVDAYRAVQVTVRQPAVSMTLARVVGQGTWNVGQTSVAGMTFVPNYAIVTLQPPYYKHSSADANYCTDLVVSGNNTVLNLALGDVGTNTSAATTNKGLITLQSGYYIDYIDAQSAPYCGGSGPYTWTQVSGQPQGQQLGSLIPDPAYYYARFPTSGATPAPTFTGDSDPNAQVPCTDASVDFPTDATTVSTYLTPPAGGTLTCYRPGVYSGPFTVATKDIAYLAPGAYWFQGGLTVNGTLGGGLVDGQPGVALLFPESGTNEFYATSGATVVLNMGSASCSSDSCRATPATDFAGKPVETTSGHTITVEVQRDGNCFNGTNDTTPYYLGCSGDINGNHTVKMAGNAYLVQIAGVIYGPSDNMQITGGTSQEGYLGQVWSWTVTYTGGSTLNQQAFTKPENGAVRLDTACSGPIGFGLGPGIVCNSP